jgi:hypothetical protein
LERTYTHKGNKRDLKVLPRIGVGVKFEDSDATLEDYDNSKNSVTNDALGGRAVAAYFLLSALLTLFGFISVLIYFLT